MSPEKQKNGNKSTKNKHIFVYANNACEKRKLDAQRIIDYMKANGYDLTYNPKDADVIMLSSCGTTDWYTQQFFDLMERYKKYDAELIAMGCVPKTDPIDFNKRFKGRYFVTDNLDEIDDLFPEHTVKLKDIPDSNHPFVSYDADDKQRIKRWLIQNKITKKIYVKFYSAMLSHILGDQHILMGNKANLPIDHLFFVRTSIGCNMKCAYCAIKLATGPLKSKPFDTCISEFKKGLDQGYKQFLLPAGDTGAYGTDIGRTFPELLRKFTSFEGDYSIGIYAYNPIWFVKQIDDIQDSLKTGKVKSIVVPFQAGNHRILKQMNRYSNPDKIKAAILKAKKAYPEIAILSQCIVGFPSETWEEFEDTLKFIVDSKIDIGVILGMCVKVGTEAVDIEPKVPQEEIEKRVKYASKYLKKAGYKTSLTGTILMFGGKKHN